MFEAARVLKKVKSNLNETATPSKASLNPRYTLYDSCKNVVWKRCSLKRWKNAGGFRKSGIKRERNKDIKEALKMRVALPTWPAQPSSPSRCWCPPPSRRRRDSPTSYRVSQPCRATWAAAGCTGTSAFATPTTSLDLGVGIARLSCSVFDWSESERAKGGEGEREREREK